MNIILIGRQGSGKGTQAIKIVQKYGLKHYSTGDALRAEKDSGSELSKKISKLIDNGEMVSDEIVEKIIKEAIKDYNEQGIIFDGFPRTKAQAEFLSKQTKIDALIEIHISDEEAMKRVAGRYHCPTCKEIYNTLSKPPKQEGVCDNDGEKLVQRADDHKEKILRRLAAYHKKTEPILKYYKEQDVEVHIINGEKSVEEVFKEIQEQLKK